MTDELRNIGSPYLRAQIIEYQKVCEMAAQGKTRKDIAEHLGKSYAGVVAYLKRHNITVKDNRQRGFTKEWHNKVIFLREAGMSYAEIGRAFGVSKQRVERVFNKQCNDDA